MDPKESERSGMGWNRREERRKASKDMEQNRNEWNRITIRAEKKILEQNRREEMKLKEISNIVRENVTCSIIIRSVIYAE